METLKVLMQRFTTLIVTAPAEHDPPCRLHSRARGGAGGGVGHGRGVAGEEGRVCAALEFGDEGSTAAREGHVPRGGFLKALKPRFFLGVVLQMTPL